MIYAFSDNLGVWEYEPQTGLESQLGLQDK